MVANKNLQGSALQHDVNIIGTGGNGNYAICSTNCLPKQNYFQRLCGSNGDIGIPQTSGCNNDYGFVKFTVDTNRIVGTYVSTSGTFSDTYTISVNNPGGDVGINTNPIVVNVPLGTGGGSGSGSVITINSFGGFAGTVTLTPSTTNVPGIFAFTPYPNYNLTLQSGGTGSYTQFWAANCDASVGFYPNVLMVTGTSSGLQFPRIVTFSMNVTPSSVCNPGGGGGSVATDTLITLANNSLVPVQYLQPGMQLRAYDWTSHSFVVSEITSFSSVTIDNYMVISTASGVPLITDQNPAQHIYVIFPNGTWAELPVTQLQVGDLIFKASTSTWDV